MHLVVSCHSGVLLEEKKKNGRSFLILEGLCCTAIAGLSLGGQEAGLPYAEDAKITQRTQKESRKKFS
jgi:hypothetical protein